MRPRKALPLRLQYSSCFRGRPASTFKLHDDDEPAQNAKKSDQEPLSKSAAKNKKRREAARKKKEDTTSSSAMNGGSAPIEKGVSNNVTHLSGKCDNGGNLSSDPEAEKKLRKLNDKLTAIQKLKQQQAEGKQLEKNQIEKISKEKELLLEIQKLKI